MQLTEDPSEGQLQIIGGQSKQSVKSDGSSEPSGHQTTRCFSPAQEPVCKLIPLAAHSREEAFHTRVTWVH